MTTLSVGATRVGRLFVQYRGAAVPIAVVSLLGVLLFPLRPWMMSVLLLTNITFAVVILLTTVYVRGPLEFSVFPRTETNIIIPTKQSEEQAMASVRPTGS